MNYELPIAGVGSRESGVGSRESEITNYAIYGPEKTASSISSRLREYLKER